MRITTTPPIHSSSALDGAPPRTGGILHMFRSALIVIGCVGLGMLLVVASLLTWPIRLVRRHLGR